MTEPSQPAAVSKSIELDPTVVLVERMHDNQTLDNRRLVLAQRLATMTAEKAALADDNAALSARVAELEADIAALRPVEAEQPPAAAKKEKASG